MTAVVYDAAVLVAADRNDRRAWAEHKARLELCVVPLVPAPVVAQVSRSPQQAQLRRFLTGCAVVPLWESEAHEAGWLLDNSGTADVMDAVVVTIALREKAIILTSDRDDIKRIVSASGREVERGRRFLRFLPANHELKQRSGRNGMKDPAGTAHTAIILCCVATVNRDSSRASTRRQQTVPQIPQTRLSLDIARGNDKNLVGNTYICKYTSPGNTSHYKPLSSFVLGTRTIEAMDLGDSD